MPSSPLDDLSALVAPTPGTINYAPALTPDQIARQSGFPTAGSTRLLAPRQQLQLQPKTTLNPVTGTTEIVPGGTDLIENLLREFILPSSPQKLDTTGGVRG